MFAIMAPGQGAQVPGMLATWLRDPVRAELVRSWSEASGCDLVHLGTKASAAEISRTENTQPLLVTAGLLALGAVPDGVPDGALVAAGHSIGELTAAAFAGVLSPADAVRLAAVRGQVMAEACADAPTSMTAVVGGDEQEVLARIAECGLTPATFNGSGQIVAAGLVSRLERLAEAPPAGAALRPLSVAGAFHTQHMAPAREKFAEVVRTVRFEDARHLLLSNADGAVVRSADDIRDRLVEQITRPVRWDLCLRTLGELAPGLTVAVPPARTLSSVLRRQLPHLDVLPIATERDLAVARRRLPSALDLVGAGGPSRVGA